MNWRSLLLVPVLAAVGLGVGCTAAEDKQPKAPENAPKLEQKTPAGGAGPKPQ